MQVNLRRSCSIIFKDNLSFWYSYDSVSPTKRRILLEMSTFIFFVALISNSFLNNPLKLTTLIYLLSFFRYYTVAPEERIRLNLQDPLCELFPKMAACNYYRYGMGGREDQRHAICILGTVTQI